MYHSNRTLMSGIVAGDFLVREDHYVSGDNTELTHYVTFLDNLTYTFHGVPMNQAAKLFNVLQQQCFKWMPFHARQLGTQFVINSSFVLTAETGKLFMPTVRVAKNGYQLILNPSRTTVKHDINADGSKDVGFNLRIRTKHFSAVLFADVHVAHDSKCYLSYLKCVLGTGEIVEIRCGTTAYRKDFERSNKI